MTATNRRSRPSSSDTDTVRRRNNHHASNNHKKQQQKVAVSVLGGLTAFLMLHKLSSFVLLNHNDNTVIPPTSNLLRGEYIIPDEGGFLKQRQELLKQPSDKEETWQQVQRFQQETSFLTKQAQQPSSSTVDDKQQQKQSLRQTSNGPQQPQNNSYQYADSLPEDKDQEIISDYNFPSLEQRIILQMQKQRMMDSCTQCTNIAPPLYGKSCSETDSSTLMANCLSSSFWMENKFCQQSCFEADAAYAGDDCCDDSYTPPPVTLTDAPTEPPTKAPITPPPHVGLESHIGNAYGNSHPHEGPWEECVGWEGHDCHDYIQHIVQDKNQLHFSYIAVRYQQSPEEVPVAVASRTAADADITRATTSVTGSSYSSSGSTMDPEEQHGIYTPLGAARADGTLLEEEPINLHRVIIQVNEYGIVTNIPKRR